MKQLSPQQLLEIDRCFQHVCERIAHDNVHPRKVLFGSTVDLWMKGEMSIVAATNVPGYVIPCLRVPSDSLQKEL